MLRGTRFALAAACALTWVGCTEVPSPPDEVPVSVGGVGFDEATGAPVILLEEEGGDRVLPIWIGIAEARSIAAELESETPPRPNTHDLAKRMLSGLEARVLRVVVTELKGNTYYALLTVQQDGEQVEIDSRPSDGIAMALRFEAPVFVRSSLFDERSKRQSDEDEAEVSL